MVEVRPAAPGDGAGIAAVYAASLPWLVKTARGVEAELSPGTGRLVLVAAEADTIVGFGNVFRPDPAEDAPRVRIAAHVAPQHRGRGIGRTLAAEVERIGTEFGAASLLTVVDDAAAARRFAERRGFVIDRPMSQSRARLADSPDPVDPPAGLRLTTYDELDPRQVWDATAAVVAGDPSGLSHAPPYEDWLETDWNYPDLRRDLSVAVLDGDRVASFVTTTADPDRRVIWSNLTGTVAAYRGRGLAKVVKSHALRRAHAAGLETAFTGNDADNRPMLAVNRWLGYRPAGSAWTAGKVLR
ncbi:GCN5-related N-acetyltransferase [Kribbella flavida DSM 17836]|uniref:GCN5-related N-acetyltransferase n=1 Tax=Kribbella flavida (strain DSM 17836 / JCM 10339 / NBRC 14399) TaxID=479435 RepID=D2Q169_KRIFD|nr:GNAT family N-acetyltransferase [Kribbella flavida]ADB35770.1 GCN5-related N-acetyltransferase [Kribbella flavida DSM 17836]